MKVIVKKLQGGECSVDVLPTTCISDVKRQVAQKLNIPAEEQKLLLLGRTLADNQTVQSYPAIKEGTKLNLVVKKPDGLYEACLKHFRKAGMAEKDAIIAAKKIQKVVLEKFKKLSWDDIERLSLDCLLEEREQRRAKANDNKPECEDMYGL